MLTLATCNWRDVYHSHWLSVGHFNKHFIWAGSVFHTYAVNSSLVKPLSFTDSPRNPSVFRPVSSVEIKSVESFWSQKSHLIQTEWGVGTLQTYTIFRTFCLCKYFRISSKLSIEKSLGWQFYEQHWEWLTSKVPLYADDMMVFSVAFSLRLLMSSRLPFNSGRPHCIVWSWFLILRKPNSWYFPVLTPRSQVTLASIP